MNQEVGIIKSLLDNDLYKFTQQQAVFELFQREHVTYDFINRGKTSFPEGFDLRLRQELKKMESLSLQESEAKFLIKKCGRYLKHTYIDLLKSYRYDSSEIEITQNEGELTLTITGYWSKTILWEVPLLAVISELYFQMVGKPIHSREERLRNNVEKGAKFSRNGVKVADFGTRRRYSYANHLEVMQDLLSVGDIGTQFIVGTSNVHIAMVTDINPIGTHAHEWISGIAALKGYSYANKNMMDDWIKVYKGELGIALTDTFGVDAFLRDFDTFYANLFDGVRHDSGNPFLFTEKMVGHYKHLGIDPISKTIIFSDGLNADLAIELKKHCKNLGVKCSFGIGTHLTNDLGIKALNIVIKMVSINNRHVIKLSDVKEKHTGDLETIELVKRMVGYTSDTEENLTSKLS
jgi:nicotinate phosphoribosyltransferase